MSLKSFVWMVCLWTCCVAILAQTEKQEAKKLPEGLSFELVGAAEKMDHLVDKEDDGEARGGPVCVEHSHLPNPIFFGPAPAGWPLTHNVREQGATSVVVDGTPLERLFTTGSNTGVWQGSFVGPTADQTYTATLTDDQNQTTTCDHTVEVAVLPPALGFIGSRPNLSPYEIPAGTVVDLTLRADYALSAEIEGDLMDTSFNEFSFSQFFDYRYTVVESGLITATVTGPDGEFTTNWNVTVGNAPGCVETRQFPDTRFEPVEPQEFVIDIGTVNAALVTMNGIPLTEFPSSIGNALVFWSGTFTFDSDTNLEFVITNSDDEQVTCEQFIDISTLPIVESQSQFPDTTLEPVAGGTTVTLSVTGEDIYGASLRGTPLTQVSGTSVGTSTWEIPIVADATGNVVVTLENNNEGTRDVVFPINTTCDSFAPEVVSYVSSCTLEVSFTVDAAADGATAEWQQQTGPSVTFDADANTLAFTGEPGETYTFTRVVSSPSCADIVSPVLIHVVDQDLDGSSTVDLEDLIARAAQWYTINEDLSVDINNNGFVDLYDFLEFVNCVEPQP